MSATDIGSSARAVSMFDPEEVALSTALTGTEIDTKGWRWLYVVISTGTVAATAAGDIELETSATSGSGYSVLSGSNVAIAATDDDTVFTGLVDLQQMNRYVRTGGTTGAGGTTKISVVGILYGAGVANLPDLTSGGADELSFTVLS